MSASITNIQLSGRDSVHLLNGTEIVRNVSQIMPNTQVYLMRNGLNILIFQPATNAENVVLADGTNSNSHLQFSTTTVQLIGSRSYTPIDQSVFNAASLNEARAIEIYNDLVQNIFKGCCSCSSDSSVCSIQYQFNSGLGTGTWYYASGVLIMSIESYLGQDFTDLFSELPDGSWINFYSSADQTVYVTFEVGTATIMSGYAVFNATIVSGSSSFVNETVFCVSINPALGGGGGSGTVTSVALTVPTGLSVSGSPVTTSGTLAVSTVLNGILYGNGANTIAVISLGNGLVFVAPTLSLVTQMSITLDALGLKLVNDETTPAEQYNYGTAHTSGTKGWQQNFLIWQDTPYFNIWTPYLTSPASMNPAGGAAENFFMGVGALDSITIGKRNTVLGNGSNLFALTDSWYTTAIGYGNQLVGNPYATTIIGCLNGKVTGGGGFNTLLGYGNLASILGNNGNAQSNVAVGYNNLIEVTGNRNVAVGFENFVNATTINDNIAIGNGSGDSITTADNVILIGVEVDGTAGDQHQLVIGHSFTGGGTGTWIDPDYIPSATSTELLYYNRSTGAVTGGAVSATTVSSPIKQNTTITHTGTVAETIIYSQLFAAGTFQANDILSWFTSVGGTSNANNKTFRVYLNTSSSLVGATLIATVGPFTTNNLSTTIERTLTFKNSLASQQIFSATTNSASSFTQTGNGPTSLTQDFTVNQYFIISAQLANAADSMFIYSLRSLINR